MRKPYSSFFDKPGINVVVIVFEGLVFDFTAQIERLGEFTNFEFPDADKIELSYLNRITVPDYLCLMAGSLLISTETDLLNKPLIAKNGCLPPNRRENGTRAI